MSGLLFRLAKLNALQKREPQADCDGVYGFRIRKKKAHSIKKKKKLCIKQKANVSVPTGWETAFIRVKGCEGSNSPLLQKVVYVGRLQRMGRAEPFPEPLCASV